MAGNRVEVCKIFTPTIAFPPTIGFNRQSMIGWRGARKLESTGLLFARWIVPVIEQQLGWGDLPNHFLDGAKWKQVRGTQPEQSC